MVPIRYPVQNGTSPQNGKSISNLLTYNIKLLWTFPPGKRPDATRQAARAQPDPDHRPVCASGAGFGQGLGGAGRRQHLGGFPDGRFGNGEAARAAGYGQFRVTSYRGTVGTAKRRQASSLSPRQRRVTLSVAGKPGIINFSESVRWPVAEKSVTTGKASRERIPIL